MQLKDWHLSVSLEDDGRSCVWSLGDEGVTSIRWNLKLMDWLLEEITRRPVAGEQQKELGGVLLGTFHKIGDHGQFIEVRVNSFVPVSCSYPSGPLYHLSDEDKLALRDPLPEWVKHSPWSVVGFYRSQCRPGLEFDNQDQKLAQEYFSNPANVFLLIKLLGEDNAIGGLFTWRQGELSKAPVISFPFDSRKISVAKRKLNPILGPRHGGWNETRDVSRGFDEFPPQPPISDNTGERRIGRDSGRFCFHSRLQRGAAVCVLCLIAFLLIWVRIHTGKRDSALNPGIISADAALNLSGFVESDHVRLKWDPHAPAITLELNGSLLIEDGGFHNSIPLTPFALRQGTVVYFPLTNSPTFQLRVGSATEGITVLDVQSASLSNKLSGSKRPFKRPAPEAWRTVPGNLGISALVAEAPGSPLFEGSPRSKHTLSERVGAPRLEHGALVEPKVVRAGSTLLETEEHPKKEANSVPAAPAERALLSPIVPSELPPSIGFENRSVTNTAPGIQSNPPPPSQTSDAMPDRVPVRAANTKDSERNELSATATSSIFADIRDQNAVPVPPRPLRQIMPSTRPLGASMAAVPRTIQIQVRIDASGHVVQAHALANESHKSNYLSSRAVDAAKLWIFEPAKVHGQSVASDYMITFHFALQK